MELLVNYFGDMFRRTLWGPISFTKHVKM